MSTTAFYDALIESMPAGLPRQVYAVLAQHIGEENKIPLDGIMLAVFGQIPEGLTIPQRTTWFSTRERQVREAIEILRRDHHVPILAESGKAGRWLAANQEELDSCLAELRARHRHLGDMILSLAMAQVPGKEPNFNGPKQSRLWS